MEEYIKAKVKASGEPVYVKPCEPQRFTTRSYQTKDGQIIAAYALEFEKEIDWEQRRYEIAREICANNCMYSAKQCVSFADALIEELKKNNN